MKPEEWTIIQQVAGLLVQQYKNQAVAEELLGSKPKWAMRLEVVLNAAQQIATGELLKLAGEAGTTKVP